MRVIRSRAGVWSVVDVVPGEWVQKCSCELGNRTTGRKGPKL